MRVLLLVFLFLNTSIFAIMPIDNNYDNWNWEDQSKKNWVVYDGGDCREIIPPFTPYSEKVGSLVDIYLTRDYTKEKGWKLLWAQFDSDYPYFILVNRYRSLIRAFFYIEGTPFSHILSSLEYHDGLNPAVLGLSREFQHSYSENKKDPSLSDNFIFSNIVKISSTKNWCVSEFPIIFDPNIKSDNFNDKKWVFKFFGCDDYDIHLKSTGELLEKDEIIVASQHSGFSVGDFDASLVKVASKVTSITKNLKKKEIENEKNINNHSNVVLKAFKSTVISLANVASKLSFIPALSSTVSGICGLLGIVSSPISSNTPPMSFSFDMETYGTMKIKYVLGGNTIKIPGVNGKYFPNVNWSPFDCPIGSFTLKTPLTVIKTKGYKKYYCDGVSSIFSYTDDDGYNRHRSIKIPNISSNLLFLKNGEPTKIDKEMYEISSYKVSSNKLEIALNNIDGRNLKDIKCCLMFRMNNYKSSDFDIENEVYRFAVYDADANTITIPVHNIIYDYLLQGYLKLYRYDLDNDICEIGTPYINPEQLSGLVIEAPVDAEVYIKILASYISSKSKAPIVFQYSFPVIIKEDEISPKFPILIAHLEQPRYKFEDYYQSELKTVVDYETNKSFEGNQIIMKNGFIGKPGFSAKHKSAYPYNGSIEYTEYNYNCNLSE